MKRNRRPVRKRPSPPPPSRAAWMAARARNALRRPVFVGTVSIITFAASLIAIVVVPQQARRAATALRPPASARPDTEPTAAALREAERQAASADSAVTSARAELTQILTASAAAVAADTTVTGAGLSADVRNRRDSLTADVALLGRLLARAENAPLLGSYRALAEAAPMRADVRAQQLLDSLVEIERERESYNAVGGVDPVFVALTARANELGHSIEVLADARRAAVQRTLDSLTPPPAAMTALASRPLPDTLVRIMVRDTARSIAAAVAARLAHERAELVALDAREARARDLANVGASPPAMLAAALVFGAMIGFGVALLDEVRRPRVANAFEVERATGMRVLGVIRLLPQSPERGRRASDRERSPYIDPGADGHQLIYLTVATAGANVVMLTVTGDNPAVSAVVAINFAAIAAQEARATLLIDTDSTSSAVSSALRLSASAGLGGVVGGTVSWPEAARVTRIGRDRTIDVVPSGDDPLPLEEITALLQRDGSRLSRRYDAIVLVSALEQASLGLPSSLPIADVIYCARAGKTVIAELKKSVEEIARAGSNLRGIVLWSAADPVLYEVKPVDRVEREAVPATA
jgi:Mrp family chromosome partitioning ATPase